MMNGAVTSRREVCHTEINVISNDDTAKFQLSQSVGIVHWDRLETQANALTPGR